MLPGLCNRAVHTAAGHSEGKAGVDLPPLWHQQGWLHKQRGEAGLSHRVVAQKPKSTISALSLSLFVVRKWQRLWEPSMTWWASTPTLRWRGTSHSSTWTLFFRCVWSTQPNTSTGPKKAIQSVNAKLVSYSIYFLLHWLYFLYAENG